MDNQKIFADGFLLKAPRPGAPDFVLGSISIKADEAIPFLELHVKNTGWVNLTMKKSQQGKLYLELDNWSPALARVEKQQWDKEPVEGQRYHNPIHDAIGKYPEGNGEPTI